MTDEVSTVVSNKNIPADTTLTVRGIPFFSGATLSLPVYISDIVFRDGVYYVVLQDRVEWVNSTEASWWEAAEDKEFQEKEFPILIERASLIYYKDGIQKVDEISIEEFQRIVQGADESTYRAQYYGLFGGVENYPFSVTLTSEGNVISIGQLYVQ